MFHLTRSTAKQQCVPSAIFSSRSGFNWMKILQFKLQLVGNLFYCNSHAQTKTVCPSINVVADNFAHRTGNRKTTGNIAILHFFRNKLAWIVDASVNRFLFFDIPSPNWTTMQIRCSSTAIKERCNGRGEEWEGSNPNVHYFDTIADSTHFIFSNAAKTLVLNCYASMRS